MRNLRNQSAKVGNRNVESRSITKRNGNQEAKSSSITPRKRLLKSSLSCRQHYRDKMHRSG